jgi:hypothetical protein
MEPQFASKFLRDWCTRGKASATVRFTRRRSLDALRLLTFPRSVTSLLHEPTEYLALMIHPRLVRDA